jgi:hypothetical protein
MTDHVFEFLAHFAAELAAAAVLGIIGFALARRKPPKSGRRRGKRR